MGSQVIVAGAAAFILLAFGGGPRPRPAAPQQPEARGFMMRQQIIIRVPTGARRIAPAAPSLLRWRERGGPRCISANQIVGATLLGARSVDLIRATTAAARPAGKPLPGAGLLSRLLCHATADGRICADRDSVRSRAGGECQIDDFRSLTPERP